jgi:hypothetical protein
VLVLGWSVWKDGLCAGIWVAGSVAALVRGRTLPFELRAWPLTTKTRDDAEGGRSCFLVLGARRGREAVVIVD